jgi:alpha-tubulin suppressor-like RCC1 family protein
MKISLIILIALVCYLNSESQVQCWKSIDAGAYHNLAINQNGTLWAWGRNNDNQLGDGTTVNRNVPTQIGTDTDWKIISAGGNYSIAIKQNGTLWAWGYLPIFAGSIFSTPTKISNETNWISISAGDGHHAAIKTDGSLWAWGKTIQGHLESVL